MVSTAMLVVESNLFYKIAVEKGNLKFCKENKICFQKNMNKHGVLRQFKSAYHAHSEQRRIS